MYNLVPPELYCEKYFLVTELSEFAPRRAFWVKPKTKRHVIKPGVQAGLEHINSLIPRPVYVGNFLYISAEPLLHSRPSSMAEPPESSLPLFVVEKLRELNIELAEGRQASQIPFSSLKPVWHFTVKRCFDCAGNKQILLN